LKAIESVKQPGNHKVIDLFMLLILHDTPRRKAVESLFRNKIRAGCFTDAYLTQVFSIHSQVPPILYSKHFAVKTTYN